MTLVPFESDIISWRSRSEEGDWRLCRRWHTAVGAAEIWLDREAPWYASPVRIGGDVPHAVALDLWRLGQKTWFGTGWDAHRYLGASEVPVDGKTVVFSMERHGLRRRARQVQIAVDGRSYVGRLRGFGSSEIVRADGEPIWRSPTFRDPLLADGASATEITIAALFVAANLPDRMPLALWKNL